MWQGSYLFLVGICQVLELFSMVSHHFLFTDYPSYAVFMFVLSIIVFVTRVRVHIYLISMALRIQKLFRDFGHIKGRTGDIIIYGFYFIYFGYLLYFYIFRATILLMINTDRDFECGPIAKELFFILGVW